MGNGKPFYFNRSTVDAAQIVVLASRRYDVLLGESGGAGALFPAFSDEAGRNASADQFALDASGPSRPPAAEQSTEAAWLLGALYYLDVIEGVGDTIASVVAGAEDALAESSRRHQAMWRRTMPRAAETVLAVLGGDPSRHGLGEMADALVCASRVVRPGGNIVLMTGANPPADVCVALLREANKPEEVIGALARRKDFSLPGLGVGGRREAAPRFPAVGHAEGTCRQAVHHSA